MMTMLSIRYLIPREQLKEDDEEFIFIYAKKEEHLSNI